MTDSASWVSRLERRLSKLADTASKESIQALSKWIGFRRKHVKAFSKSLVDAIENPSSIATAAASSTVTSNNGNNTPTRQWLYLQIVHESIILDSGTSRWDRLAEMREILGESCVVKVSERGCLDAVNVKKVEGMVKQWDSLNVFGGPTLINLIKKKLASPAIDAATVAEKTATTKAAESTPKPEKTPPASPKRKRETPPKATVDETPISEKPTATSDEPASSKDPNAEATSSLPKTPKKEVEYDFESKVRLWYCTVRLI